MDQQTQPRWTILEWLTAAVLVGVVLALAWMIVAAYQPEWLRLPSLHAEIIIVLVLLGSALLLVSVLVALRDALRRREIYVAGGNRWRNPEEDLPGDFEASREVRYAALRQPTDPTEFMAGGILLADRR